MSAAGKGINNETVAAAFKQAHGNVRETARILGVARSTVRRHISKVGLGKKPVAKGTLHGIKTTPLVLPKEGRVRRYILTSAQNNTRVHDRVWQNILALAKYYNAQIFVGTFSYDQNAYGPLAVKKDTFKPTGHTLWYDEKVIPYIKDERIQLGKGLVWCGEMNIIPTASDPLAGLETYSGRHSAVFPHAKIAMRSIAAIQGSGTKLNYTTGTVTKRNYIQKRAGLTAEFHHTYGGLLVEVNDSGIWKVRQLDAEDDTGTMYDLTTKVENGRVTEGHQVEAITWGDIHATIIDTTVLKLSCVGEDSMLDVLRPKYQFIHDLIEGASVCHHTSRRPLDRFKTSIRGLTVIQTELRASTEIMNTYHRKNVEMIVVNSNHDRWLDRWLDEFDPRVDDARNAELYHEGNAARYRAVRLGTDLKVLEYLLRKYAEFKIPARFLGWDESFTICNKRIECGQHGDLGSDGKRGSPASMSKMGRRANVGHTHTAGIWDGLYVAGTSTNFRMGYNHGYSSWTHSHIVTYPNGKRTIITMYKDAWRAE